MAVAALRRGSPLMETVAPLLFTLALLVATPGAALAADTDTVVLRNGDRLKG